MPQKVYVCNEAPVKLILRITFPSFYFTSPFLQVSGFCHVLLTTKLFYKSATGRIIASDATNSEKKIFFFKCQLILWGCLDGYISHCRFVHKRLGFTCDPIQQTRFARTVEQFPLH